MTHHGTSLCPHDSEAALQVSSFKHDVSMSYDSCLLSSHQVSECNWPARQAPSLHNLFAVCKNMHNWLRQNPKNVCVITCSVREKEGQQCLCYSHSSHSFSSPLCRIFHCIKGLWNMVCSKQNTVCSLPVFHFLWLVLTFQIILSLGNRGLSKNTWYTEFSSK